MGRTSNSFVDNEADCAASTKGISRNTAPLILVYSLTAKAAQYDKAVWTERVPTQVNPADLPSRGRQLSFATEPSEDLATLGELPHARSVLGAFAARELTTRAFTFGGLQHSAMDA